MHHEQHFSSSLCSSVYGSLCFASADIVGYIQITHGRGSVDPLGINLPTSAPNMLQCPACGQTYTRQSSLNRHFASKHQENPDVHICPQCNECFSRYDVLRRHQRRRHAGSRRQYNRTIDAGRGLGTGTLALHELYGHFKDVGFQEIPGPCESLPQSEPPYLEGESDAPFTFVEDIDMSLIDEVLEILAGYDDMGRVDISRWPGMVDRSVCPRSLAQINLARNGLILRSIRSRHRVLSKKLLPHYAGSIVILRFMGLCTRARHIFDQAPRLADF